MKKSLLTLGLAVGLAALTAACGDPAIAPSTPPPEETHTAAPEQTATLTCRIVDGAEEGSLLLADLENAGGVYRLGVGEGVSVTVDGEEASAADLTDGMEVTVIYDGMVQESYPMGFYEVYALEAVTPPGGSYTDLCGFYLQVLDDLWQADDGLNGDTVGIDLSQAPGGLTEAEQAAVAWRFGELHGVSARAAAFDQLVEKGYITADPLDEGDPDGPAFYQWEGGCLLTVTPHEGEETEAYSLPVLRFDAEKWASSLGAYCFYDCTAVWPEFGSWSDYTVRNEMIA